MNALNSIFSGLPLPPAAGPGVPAAPSAGVRGSGPSRAIAAGLRLSSSFETAWLPAVRCSASTRATPAAPAREGSESRAAAFSELAW